MQTKMSTQTEEADWIMNCDNNRIFTVGNDQTSQWKALWESSCRNWQKYSRV